MMRRRRTYITTKVVGELLRGIDPAVSEWGNPIPFIWNCPTIYGEDGNPGN